MPLAPVVTEGVQRDMLIAPRPHFGSSVPVWGSFDQCWLSHTLKVSHYWPLLPHHKVQPCSLSAHLRVQLCKSLLHHMVQLCSPSPHHRVQFCQSSPHHKIQACWPPSLKAQQASKSSFASLKAQFCRLTPHHKVSAAGFQNTRFCFAGLQDPVFFVDTGLQEALFFIDTTSQVSWNANSWSPVSLLSSPVSLVSDSLSPFRFFDKLLNFLILNSGWSI